jgi:hypothetical protein
LTPSIHFAVEVFCNPFTFPCECFAIRSPCNGTVPRWSPWDEWSSPANTRFFNDYVGPVAADDTEVVKDQPSLYELANIDRDRYTILAFDLRIEGPVTATVFAIDRLERGRSLVDTPVVSFDIPEPNIEDIIRHAFKTISIRFVTQPLRDLALVGTEPS